MLAQEIFCFGVAVRGNGESFRLWQFLGFGKNEGTKTQFKFAFNCVQTVETTKDGNLQVARIKISNRKLLGM